MTDLPVAIDLRYSHKPGTGRYGHQAFALADSDIIARNMFFGYNPKCSVFLVLLNDRP